jgi:hypothetical protein
MSLLINDFKLHQLRKKNKEEEKKKKERKGNAHFKA